jgi:hypothetical protein
MTLRGTTLPLLLLVLCLLGLALFSFGQTEAATLSGLITDPQGKVVPGVAVEITNVDTNVSVHQTTNNVGLYVAVGLNPGRYRVSVTKDGFRRIDLTELVLNVQDVLSRNFQLQLGPVSSSVTVVAEAAKVETSPAVSTLVDRTFVENLPLNGRSFNTLMQLTPGVVIAPTDGMEPGQFSMNGQRTNANYFEVDGVSANFGVRDGIFNGQGGAGGTQAFNALGGTSSLVSVDAMQEFRIQTSSFAPEYGRTPGGQVSIVTRAGTNSFHGGIFDYFRNEALDANDWFANAANLPRTAKRQNDFGGFLGGPIIRGNTFFFFSYEGLLLDQPQTLILSVPSVSLRGSAVSSVAPFLNAFPLPNGPISADGGTAQFTGSSSNPIRSDAVSIRIDHSFGDKAQLFGRYNYAPSSVGTGF